MKWPSKNQWQSFFKILNLKEKICFFICFIIFFLSLSFLVINFYFKNTKIVPAEGGKYIEGMIGTPRFLNPIYSPLSDVDRDLVELIFSGLMKYEDGKLKPDLAKEYKILENGKIYEISLKENLFWQDGHPLTADDVIFTIQTIQNPEINSPLRGSWLGVEVEKIDDLSLRFKLKNESAVFLENLTLKIIPKHIWENIPAKNFPFSEFNLNPIVSGKYKLKEILKEKEGKINSLTLIKNPLYYGKKPYLSEITFIFFEKEENLIDAFKLGQIQGFSISKFEKIPENGILYRFPLPRYFAIFFNLKNSKVLSEREVRLALNYGTDKKEILEKVISSYGKIIDSPILAEIFGFKKVEKIYQFDLEKAKEILEKAGFLEGENGFREKIIKKEPSFQFKNNLFFGSKGKEVEELQKCLAKDKEIYPEGEISGYFGQKTKEAVIRFQEKYAQEILNPFGLEKGNGEVREKTREKLNEICFERGEERIPLKFSLTTVDQPILVQTAEVLKEQWKKLGVEVELKIYNINDLEREIIRKRDFEAFLFGEVLGLIPDPFPFWHSSQKGEFGLNLSNYENKEVDRLLEAARKEIDEGKRRENLEKFQEILNEDSPAIFLYSPDYLYFLSKDIKGVKENLIFDPSKRFSEIENWYLKERRVF